MDVELLVIPGCPGAQEAETLLRAALDELGLTEVRFSVGVIETPEAAQARAFGGSPAFVVDGEDLFAIEGPRGSMACRVYTTPDGLRNVPTLQDLRNALVQHAGETS